MQIVAERRRFIVLTRSTVDWNFCSGLSRSATLREERLKNTKNNLKIAILWMVYVHITYLIVSIVLMLNISLATLINSEQFTPWSQVTVVCEQLDSEQGVSPVTTREQLVGRVQYVHTYK